MNFILLDIPVILGIDIEVYFILIILGIPTFFFSRWVCKKYIKKDTKRKISTWITTIILTPAIYFGLIWLWVFCVSYYPNRDFEKQRWFGDTEKRYELSKNIIESKMLIGKSKTQVRQILGDEPDNKDNFKFWRFELGVCPDVLNIDDSYLLVEFEGDKVVNVEQQR